MLKLCVIEYAPDIWWKGPKFTHSIGLTKELAENTAEYPAGLQYIIETKEWFPEY